MELGMEEHKEHGSCMVRMYHREARCDDQHHEKMLVMMMGASYHDDDNDDDADVDAYKSDESSSSLSYDDGDDHDHDHDDECTISKESSSSSLELADDASSLSPSSSPLSSPRSGGPLYELSELMNELPIKRGLSKYYQGKSESFKSLARVTSLEDLAKKESSYQRKLKACRSYGGGLNNFRSNTQPKPTISKKSFKPSFSNLTCLSRKPSFIATPTPPQCPLQSTF